MKELKMFKYTKFRNNEFLLLFDVNVFQLVVNTANMGQFLL